MSNVFTRQKKKEGSEYKDPYQRIMIAAAKNECIQLSAIEVWLLSKDKAIQQAASSGE